MAGLDSQIENRHIVSSLPKCAAAALFDALGEQYNITNLNNDWYPSISRGIRPTIAVSIYNDDAINENLVMRLMARKIPLLAVLSANPCRPYRNGGITYDYDEKELVYIGRSDGRTDTFRYRASPYAGFLSLPLTGGFRM